MNNNPAVASLVGSLLIALAASSQVGCQPEVVSPVSAPPDPPAAVAEDHPEHLSNPAQSHGTEPSANSETTTTSDQPSTEKSTTVAATPTPQPPPRLALAPLLKADRVYFRTATGGKKFQFKPKEADSVKFYDEAGSELCKLTMHPDKLKAKSADDHPLFELKWHADKVSFKEGSTDKELSKLQFKGKELAFVVADQLKAKIVPRPEGGYVVQDAAGTTLAILNTIDGHAAYAGPGGETILMCEETSNPLALIGLALPDLSPSQQAALLVYFVSRPEM